MSRNPHAWALEAQDLQVQVAGRPLLQPLQLRIPAGQWTAVVGPNGAGKSTLLRALAGLWPGAPLQHVKLHGQPLAAWPRKVRAQKVSWMGQAEPVDLSMRCYDAVMLGRLPHQAWLAGPSAQDRQAVERALYTTHAWAWRDRTLAELSGGERQRVLLARALAVQAALLLMDEPLANLDPPHQSDWMEIVRHWVAQGGTVVSVLHELGMALEADAMVIVDGGQVVHHGACSNPATHAALEAVFDHRVEVRAVDGVWTALPRSAPSQAAPTDGTYRLGPNTHE